MAAPSNPAGHVPIPTRSIIDDSARDVETPHPSTHPPGTASGDTSHPRVSFSQPSLRRHSQVVRTITGGSIARVSRDEESFLDKPPIPSALPTREAAAYATPLPVLPLVVLSITMLSEFLSATVCIPFLLFMVKGFLAQDQEADLGSWTGVLVSTFSLTQFLTSLLWATLAERHGERTVLFVSLLGTSLTCAAFGTSTSLPEALTFRLLQGIFAGSIGVARSSIVNITDGSNEARAYAILGFCWGFGGSAGAIIGGTFESPAKKWPDVFGHVPLFVRLPYLFPCIIAASITLIGAILSLFLARDGGSRDSAIYLPTVTVEEEEETEPTEEPSRDALGDDARTAAEHNAAVSPDGTFTQLRDTFSNRLSGIFAGYHITDAHAHAKDSASASRDPLPASSSSIPFLRKASRSRRTSRLEGSAYSSSSGSGPGGYRTRVPSTATTLRRGSICIYGTLRRRRDALGESVAVAPDALGAPPHEAPNLSQRLLMANENTVTNLSDLWVAAAINVDHDEVGIVSDAEEEIAEGFSDDGVEGGGGTPPRDGGGGGDVRTFAAAASGSSASINPPDLRRPATLASSTPRSLFELRRALAGAGAESAASPRHHAVLPHGRHDSAGGTRVASSAHPPTPAPAPGRRVSRQYSTPTRARLSAFDPGSRDSFHDAAAAGSQPRSRSRISRTFSSSSSSSYLLPSIYANAGVRAPPGLLVDPPVPVPGEREDPFVVVEGGLDTIPEGGQTHSETPRLRSALKQLPLMIILQYGLMALHSTTNDQIFLSYLVSKYEAGGLGLTAAHFSQLIALMCLAQIAYQFYLYPYLGPPRGPLSHLAMFRLGSLLFIPAYMSLTLYRVFASKAEDGNLILMTLLAISTAVRFCALTFSYTAISILLNYVSPPEVVGLANGVAQSIVCLARFVGPILGGAIWSMSIKDDPGGYPLGFIVCSVVCALAISHSFVIR